MTHVVKEMTLAADVATSGTFVVPYPTGFKEGDFTRASGHKLTAGNYGDMDMPGDFTVAGDATGFTVTYLGTTTLVAGTKIYFQFDIAGGDEDYFPSLAAAGIVSGVSYMAPVLIELGAPLTADTDNMVKAATSTELPDTETVTYTPDTDGTTPTDGVGPVVTKSGINYWELDVPRNISALTTHGSSIVAMTIVVTGLDVYENVMSETITVAATGTSATDAGLKAFKWVRSIAITAAADAEANTCSVGFGDVLGLPVHLPSAALVLADMEDGAVVTDGTFVAGLAPGTASTATTADIRGTVDPNSACNGALEFSLVALIPDPTFLGNAQYAG
jgi:hypothetical protein